MIFFELISGKISFKFINNFFLSFTNFGLIPASYISILLAKIVPFLSTISDLFLTKFLSIASEKKKFSGDKEV